MRRYSCLLVCLAFLLFASLAEGQSLEPDFQALLSQFTSAWDKSDSAGIAALFEGDGDLVIPDGLLVEGRASIRQFYSSAFERGYRGSRGTARIKRIRPMGSDVAFVDGVWRIDGAVFEGRPEAPEIGIFSLVAKRRGRTWMIYSLREQTSAHDLVMQGNPRPAGETQKQEAEGRSGPGGEPSDKARIREMEQKDIAASNNNDVDALVALWTEDGVLLQPGLAPAVGKDAIRKLLLQQRQDTRVRTISYEENWNEVRVAGTYAFEWGRIGATFQLPDGKDVRKSVRAIRVLAKEPDGSWRIARVGIIPANQP